MSKVNNTIHLVFATKNRHTTIPNELRREVFKMTYSILKEDNCFVHRINGTSIHVHILFNLHPTISLSDIVKKIKTRTSAWLTKDERFKNFEGWCNEYFAESVSQDNIPVLVEYIKTQEEHHGLVILEEEMKILYQRNHWIFLPDHFK